MLKIVRRRARYGPLLSMEIARCFITFMAFMKPDSRSSGMYGSGEVPKLFLSSVEISCSTHVLYIMLDFSCIMVANDT